MTVHAVEGSDGLCEGGSRGSDKFPKKISALDNLRVLSTGENEGLEECNFFYIVIRMIFHLTG